MNNLCESEHHSGRALSSLNWLKAHHGAKIDFRKSIVNRMPIKRGDKLLDIGCGPGFWVPLWAEKLGPEGYITGFDIAEDLIKAAEWNNKDLSQGSNVTFHCGDIVAALGAVPDADVIILMNVLGYLSTPETALADIWQHMKPGATLIVRQYDNGMTNFWPLDGVLLRQIIAATEKNEPTSNNATNSFLGRALPDLATQAAIVAPEFHADVCQITAPLTPDSRKYLGMKADWFASLSKETLSQQSLNTFRRALPPTGSGGAFEHSCFQFSTIEYQMCAKK